MPKEIFRLKAGKPPESVHTLADWMQWREQEDQRMLDGIAFFLEALCEKVARDADGEQSH